MKKRLLSLLLAGSIFLGAAPAMAGVEAPPAPPPPSEWFPFPTSNGQGDDAIFQMERDGSWYTGSLAAALHSVYENGTVMLLKDFYITNRTGIPSITRPMTLTSYDDPDTEERESCKLTCAINGHPTLLMISSDARLKDVVIDGGGEEGLAASGPLVVVQSGSLTLGEGAYIQNNRNQNNSKSTNWLGGGVFLSGTMVMESGSAVRNCRAWAGGGVAVVNSAESCLTLRGGSIENCESYQGGGVAVVWGSLRLEEGQISSCRAVEPESESLLDHISAHTELESPGEGGGVFLSWDHSVMEMTGGMVTGNRAAKSGGGIGSDHGRLTLSGGEITGNRAEEYGGGVLASPMLKTTLSGSAWITGNESGIAGFENYCLDGSEDWIGDQDGATATEPFVITGPLEEDFDLSGLARWMQPVKDDPERIYRVVAVPGEGYTITEADRAHFFSDDPRYVLRLVEEEGVRKLTLTFPVVTYRDGLEGTVFQEESHLCTGGDDTPGFAGTLEREGYTFEGWLPKVAEKVTGDAVYVAQWRKRPEPTPSPTPDIDDDDRDDDPSPAPRPTPTPVPTASPAPAVTPSPAPASEPEDFPLETEDHFAYIVGYVDGTVRPQDNISRSEVVTIFFRLMTEDFREANWTTENAFFDVSDGDWYNNALSTAAQAGLIRGCSDGGFYGERSITRGEFAAIAARFDSGEYQGPDLFSDISEYWGTEEINRAAQRGWIRGYPDGTFRPDAFITRAEAMVMVNRILHRAPAPDGLTEDVRRWPDNQENEWYYLDVQEATNGHTYERSGESGLGTWTGLKEDRDWTVFERVREE